MITTPLTPDLVHGAVEIEPTPAGLVPHRLPARARAQVTDAQLAMAEAQPAGVRVALRTAATYVELVTVPTKRVYVGMPARPDGVYELVVNGEVTDRGSVRGGTTLTIDLAAGTYEETRGEPGSVRFDGLSLTVKDLEMPMPHDEAAVLVELRSDAPVERAPTAAGGAGCTTAAPSARAPTPPRRPGPGRRWRREPPASSW